MQEKNVWRTNGFIGIIMSLILIVGGFMLVSSEISSMVIGGVILIILGSLLFSGLVIVLPNQSVVVTFFGKYIGVIRESGFHMTVPLTLRRKISMRVRNFNSSKLKVNDVAGNPIEIAAVVVFKVIDSAKAVFDVDNYEGFVEIQSETALRHVATKYPYDNYADDGISLRGDVSVVSTELTKELQERLNLAGVQVLEARLTHLAYSTEIASAMLQRQQANAIIAARAMIVDGAVGMTQMAIERIEKEGLVKFDEDRKIDLVNNLMVAIVSDRGAQPIINTGSKES
jgi:regulator of protease activity HflC (stomatin/prohibitin superfamily)